MKIGTGWVGWTQQQTDETDMEVIMRAYEGVIDKIRFMTGKSVPEVPVGPASPPSGTPMSPKLFMAMFGKH